jgi:hypothetical protein
LSRERFFRAGLLHTESNESNISDLQYRTGMMDRYSRETKKTAAVADDDTKQRSLSLLLIKEESIRNIIPVTSHVDHSFLHLSESRLAVTNERRMASLSNTELSFDGS